MKWITAVCLVITYTLCIGCTAQATTDMRDIMIQVERERSAFPDGDRQQRWVTAFGMLQALAVLGPMSDWPLEDVTVWEQRMFDYGYRTMESMPLIHEVPSPTHVQEADAVRIAVAALVEHGLPAEMAPGLFSRTSFLRNASKESNHPYWHVSFQFQRGNQTKRVGIDIDAVTSEVKSHVFIAPDLADVLAWLNLPPYENITDYLVDNKSAILAEIALSSDDLESAVRQIQSRISDAVVPAYNWTQADNIAWEQFLDEVGATQHLAYPKHVSWASGMLPEAGAIQAGRQAIVGRLAVPEPLISAFSVDAALRQDRASHAVYWEIEYEAPYTMLGDIMALEYIRLSIDAESGELLSFDFLTGGNG